MAEIERDQSGNGPRQVLRIERSAIMPFRSVCAVTLSGCLVIMASSARALETVSLKSGVDRNSVPLEEQYPVARRAIDVFLAACLSALANGNPTNAEQMCSRAIAFDPLSETGYKLRGYAYLIEHRFERAAADFQVALKMRPDDAENRAGYGQSLNGLGQFGQAVSEFARAVSLSPAIAAYHNGLCWARAGTGRNLRTALGDCNRALVLAPGTPGPFNSRGLVKLRMGKLKEAVADYDASLAVKPVQPSARFGRGLARLLLHQTLDGISDISEARRVDPDIDELFIGLGVLSRQCRHGAGKCGCPAGFPSRAEHKAPSYTWLVARLYSDPELDSVPTVGVQRLDARRA